MPLARGPLAVESYYLLVGSMDATSTHCFLPTIVAYLSINPMFKTIGFTFFTVIMFHSQSLQCCMIVVILFDFEL